MSDIHGNLLALEAVLADIARQDVDAMVNLGDLLSGPLQPAETADRLMALQASGTATIAGNHERQLLALWDAGAVRADLSTSDGYAVTRLEPRHVAWLCTLPLHHWPASDILMVHGTPGSDCTYWLESIDAEVPDGLRPATSSEVAGRLQGDPRAAHACLVLCGHTHVPRAVRVGPTLIVNPGSVGLQAYSDGRPVPHRVETGSPHARYALLARDDGAGDWHCTDRHVAYDWDTQARIALERGRPDWAHALATGRMPAIEQTKIVS